MTHTPAPWRIKDRDIMDSTDGLICTVTDSYDRSKAAKQRDISDRCLISAAPDLLEALEKAERQLVTMYRAAAPSGNYGANADGSNANENTFADQDEAVIGARAAISKARGETS